MLDSTARALPESALQPTSKKLFICDVCGKSFIKSSLLIRHSSVHTKHSPFSCHNCPRRFSQKTSLQRHLNESVCTKLAAKENKTKSSHHLCIYCDRAFNKSSDYERHVLTHGNEKNFKCTVEDCTKAFRLKQTLERHEKTHNKLSHECAVCLKIYSSEKILNNHIQKMHRPQNPEFIATQQNEFLNGTITSESIEIFFETPRASCEEITHVSNEEVVVATDEIDVKEISVLECGVCGKNFKKPIDLRRHIDAVHVRRKPFICDYCGKSFSLKCTLNRHIQTHKQERMWVTCGECSKKLSSKSSLKLHQRIHQDEKPLQCTRCALSFRTPGNLQSHLRSQTHLRRTTAIHPEPTS